MDEPPATAWTPKKIALVAALFVAMLVGGWVMNGANGVLQMLVAGVVGGAIEYGMSSFSKKKRQQ